MEKTFKPRKNQREALKSFCGIMPTGIYPTNYTQSVEFQTLKPLFKEKGIVITSIPLKELIKEQKQQFGDLCKSIIVDEEHNIRKKNLKEKN